MRQTIRDSKACSMAAADDRRPGVDCQPEAAWRQQPPPPPPRAVQPAPNNTHPSVPAVVPPVRLHAVVEGKVRVVVLATELVPVAPRAAGACSAWCRAHAAGWASVGPAGTCGLAVGGRGTLASAVRRRDSAQHAGSAGQCHTATAGAAVAHPREQGWKGWGRRGMGLACRACGRRGPCGTGCR
jgi:hypothetical protein